VKRVCAAYNELWAERGDYERCASPRDSPEFIHRIVVNYLRHELTAYEEELMSPAGRIGVRDAESMIRRRVYDAISAAYPMLAGECRAQREMRSRTP
jgi:hypothetical protein